MILYAESSAVLAWLRGETKGKTVRGLLAKAAVVIASDLTLIECDRVLLLKLSIGRADAFRLSRFVLWTPCIFPLPSLPVPLQMISPS